MAPVNSISEQKKLIKKPNYEPPKATYVQVKFEERVLGCLFKTIQNCGLTE